MKLSFDWLQLLTILLFIFLMSIDSAEACDMSDIDQGQITITLEGSGH